MWYALRNDPLHELDATSTVVACASMHAACPVTWQKGI